jgi:hypothetical protein
VWPGCSDVALDACIVDVPLLMAGLLARSSNLWTSRCGSCDFTAALPHRHRGRALLSMCATLLQRPLRWFQSRLHSWCQSAWDRLARGGCGLVNPACLPGVCVCVWTGCVDAGRWTVAGRAGPGSLAVQLLAFPIFSRTCNCHIQKRMDLNFGSFGESSLGNPSLGV